MRGPSPLAAVQMIAPQTTMTAAFSVTRATADLRQGPSPAWAETRDFARLRGVPLGAIGPDPAHFRAGGRPDTAPTSTISMRDS